MDVPRRPVVGAAVLRPELTDAVLDVTLTELADVGFGRLSMQQVAKRAGVGKSALYRRWPGKLDMVMDAIGRIGVPVRESEDTGTLEGDLYWMLVHLHRDPVDPRLADVMPDLLAEARRSSELADAFRGRLAAPRRAWARAAFDRAIARGEVRAGDARIELAMDALGSVPFWWSTVHQVSGVDDDAARRLAGFVVRGLT
ncbi:TetR/AcrR family transcriptional regulator [Pseudonocardia sp. MH-G8]|uniref:TetR/AcrR family transcriptional regulator n=1 Tax=Pseudonocardia sp. MH-G8 TaxID=1854588 RepID=UPI000BA0FA23|nr:TetR/AcrR family transcriptional regulator [Pseudonocardia sp. MH-G8]OZM80920.1 TetR family transcriptional regulator [Pseudonocardia sp. MH-G8]